MNIFVVNIDPAVAAHELCDQHVIKMVTESVQLLSNAMIFAGLEDTAPYGRTHWNHPCSKWTRNSLGNYQWLWQHADALGNEFKLRRDKEHLAHRKLLDFVPKELDLPKKGRTPFANCTPYKDMEDTVLAYKRYYINEKSGFARWNYGVSPPEWYLLKTKW